MKNVMIPVAILALATITFTEAAIRSAETPFAPNVDAETDAIRVPKNYTEWPTLCTKQSNDTIGRSMSSSRTPGLPNWHHSVPWTRNSLTFTSTPM